MPTILTSQTRQQLARLYNISDKTFSRRIRRAGFDFGSDRLLLPVQVQQVVERLGPWQITSHNAHE